MTDLETDVSIVGAGPTGLFAAYYSGFRQKHATLIDSLPYPGGQVAAMYPEKKIYDVAGFPGVQGVELVDRLVEQANQFEPTYLLGEQACTVTHDDPYLTLSTSSGRTIKSRAIIIAAGIGRFQPRQLPPAPGITDADVSYFVREPSEFRERDVVVVGGGDSAFDWATTLAPIARTVTLVHRRASFRAHEHSVEQAKRLGVRLLTDASVTRGRRADSSVHSIQIELRGAAAPLEVRCQKIVASLGFTAQLGPLLDWDIDIRDNRHIAVSTSMQTTSPGIFAAGDITTYGGKVPLIAVGFAEAATAVNNACAWMDPGESIFPGHSTDEPAAALSGS